VFPKIFLLHKVVRDAKKVEKHSIRGLPLKLFENYLANQTHLVSIEDIQS